MALYVFKCSECGFIDEVMRRMDDADQPIGCSQCGATSQRILYPGCGFEFVAFRNGENVRID